MAVIKAELVKILRDRTSVSMMECKKALQQTDGDIEAAIDLLRKSGEAKAVKKQDRLAAEGIVVVDLSADKQLAAMVEVNSETDFVAKNSKLLEFAKEIAQVVLNTKITDVQQLNEQQLASGDTIEQNRLTLVTQLGENIKLNRINLVTAQAGQALGCYVHGSPAKIASVVCLENGSSELAKDIAMHAAAMRPEYVSTTDIPEERYKKEQEISMEQTKQANSDKPENILQKIVAGRVNKFFKEITLVEQNFIKDDSVTIKQLLANNKAKIISVDRLEIGKDI
jgi:elongation factor Ts